MSYATLPSASIVAQCHWVLNVQIRIRIPCPSCPGVQTTSFVFRVALGSFIGRSSRRIRYVLEVNVHVGWSKAHAKRSVDNDERSYRSQSVI